MAIVVDANVLLRFLTEPATDRDRQGKAVASELLAKAQDGAVTLLLTDAVVAEVLFILTHPRQYDASRQKAADAVLPILMLPGCRMAHRDACLRAVALWRDHPQISFVDALVAALAVEDESTAATFDRRLQRIVGDDLWPPCRLGDPASDRR